MVAPPAAPAQAGLIDFTAERQRHVRFVGREDVPAQLDQQFDGPDASAGGEVYRPRHDRVRERPQTKEAEDLAAEWCSLSCQDPGAVPRFLKRHGCLIGRVVDNYMIGNLIGVGGAGAVFRARHRFLRHEIALKLFYPLHGVSQDLIRTVERAARGLRSLRHPGIVSLFDLGYLKAVDATSVYLVMELIRGTPLHIWSGRLGHGVDATKARIAAGLKIASALHAAHAHSFIGDLGFSETGILHGDVKPWNILIRDDDSQPVLLDFMIPDLQRRVGGREEAFRLQLGDAGRPIPYLDDTDVAWSPTCAHGTPGYMPPEQESRGIVLPASDIYALGQTFRELFTSELTDNGSPGLSRGLRGLLANMTAVEPSARPKTMAVVCSRLRSISKLVS